MKKTTVGFLYLFLFVLCEVCLHPITGPSDAFSVFSDNCLKSMELSKTLLDLAHTDSKQARTASPVSVVDNIEMSPRKIVPSKPNYAAPARPAGPPIVPQQFANNGYENPDDIKERHEALKLSQSLLKSSYDNLTDDVTPRTLQAQEQIESLFNKYPAIFNQQSQAMTEIINMYDKAMNDHNITHNEQNYETATLDILKAMQDLIKKGPVEKPEPPKGLSPREKAAQAAVKPAIDVDTNHLKSVEETRNFIHEVHSQPITNPEVHSQPSQPIIKPAPPKGLSPREKAAQAGVVQAGAKAPTDVDTNHLKSVQKAQSQPKSIADHIQSGVSLRPTPKANKSNSSVSSVDKGYNMSLLEQAKTMNQNTEKNQDDDEDEDKDAWN